MAKLPDYTQEVALVKSGQDYGYPDEDRALAVTCYYLTGNNATAAGRLWAEFKGTETFPEKGTIASWLTAGQLPSAEIAERLAAVRRARLQLHYIDEEMLTFDKAQEKVRERMDKPREKDGLFQLNGVLMTTAERVRTTLHPSERTGATNIINNMPGATLVRAEGKPQPAWEAEAIDGDSDSRTG